MPATIAVIVLLIIPVAITIAATFAEPKGVFAPYVTFFNSGFRRAVLYRTLEIALITTAISLTVGFITAYVIAQMPGRAKSIMIIAAVFSAADRCRRPVLRMADHSRKERHSERHADLDRHPQ